MTISVFDLFRIGIGPSSSHTVGPLRAARRFAELLAREAVIRDAARIRVDLYGSLALTGKGHGTDRAILAGFEGAEPESVDREVLDRVEARVSREHVVEILGRHPLPFEPRSDLVFHQGECLPFHPNGMRFRALGADGRRIAERVMYSVGGGFVVEESDAEADRLTAESVAVPYPFASGRELLERCETAGLSVSQVALANECVRMSEAEARARLLRIWQVMRECVERGCRAEGVLPGGLRLERRAPALWRRLTARPESALQDPLTVLDWVDLYALAVSEENAAGGRVVTAPTNGAAGVVPAVLHYHERLRGGSGEEDVVRFLLAAGAMGILYKENASISGAEVGCQGEVGVACSMAAAGLAEVLGGSPRQVENAAEIGIEHNLGLTCDPIGGLVQVPCIERNAMASVNAINASRIALRGTGRHLVSLDSAIATMRETGRDMQSKYKETSLGGLAVNVSEC